MTNYLIPPLQIDPRTLPRGHSVELRLRLGTDEPIIVQGMVRRVDPGVGMAIEFIHIDPGSRRRMKKFLALAEPGKVSPAGSDI